MMIDIFFILNLSSFKILIELNIFDNNFDLNNILNSSDILFFDYIFDLINLWDDLSIYFWNIFISSICFWNWYILFISSIILRIYNSLEREILIIIY